MGHCLSGDLSTQDAAQPFLLGPLHLRSTQRGFCCLLTALLWAIVCGCLPSIHRLSSGHIYLALPCHLRPCLSTLSGKVIQAQVISALESPKPICGFCPPSLQFLHGGQEWQGRSPFDKACIPVECPYFFLDSYSSSSPSKSSYLAVFKLSLSHTFPPKDFATPKLNF